MARSLRSRGIGGSRGGSGDDGISIEVAINQSDLRDLVRDISKHGDAKAFRKELSSGMRAAVKPIVVKARAAVRSQPGGRKSTGLRADIARAVQMKVDMRATSERIGIRVRLDGSKLRSHPKGIVAAYEGVRPWRHPLFGNRDKWVTQPSRGFLTEVVEADRSRVMREIEQTMNTIARKLEG